MTEAERTTLLAYHERLSRVVTRHALARASFDFRAEHGIGKAGHPLEEQLKAIIIAHRDRVMGQSSPAACDAIVRKVLDT